MLGAVGWEGAGAAGLALQQSKVTPVMVGQQSPVRPNIEHPGFAEQVASDGGSCDVVVGLEVGIALQQSNVTPSTVGQQSPVSPKALH